MMHRADSIEELLAACTPKVRRLAEAARRRIVTVVPDATERLRPGWGLIGYNAPAYFAFMAPGRDHVRIGFEWGVKLPDPKRLLEGSGSQVRHVTIRTTKALRSPALAELLRAGASRGRRDGHRRERKAMAVKDESFRDFVLDQLATFGEVECRQMFGGYGLYLDDAFFGILWRGRLFFKTDDRSRPKYTDQDMKPFQPNAQQTLTSYYEVPVDVLEDGDRLVEWARDAVRPNLPARARRRTPLGR